MPRIFISPKHRFVLAGAGRIDPRKNSLTAFAFTLDNFLELFRVRCMHFTELRRCIIICSKHFHCVRIIRRMACFGWVTILGMTMAVAVTHVDVAGLVEKVVNASSSTIADAKNYHVRLLPAFCRIRLKRRLRWHISYSRDVDYLRPVVGDRGRSAGAVELNRYKSQQ